MAFFHYLGHIVRRFWFLWLAGWVLLLVGTHLAAPPWDQVAQDKEFSFLPKAVPSNTAAKVFKEAFPENRLASNIVLVIYRTDNNSHHVEADKKYIEDVIEPGLRKIADADGGLADEVQPVIEQPPADSLFGDDAPAPKAPQAKPRPEKRSVMAKLETPNAAVVGNLLVSPDNQALLVVVELTTQFTATSNWPVISKIEKMIAELRQQGKMPPGMDIAVTGSAVIGRDQNVAQLQSTRATQLLTFIFVIGLLILIYRAPLLAIIPLVTVFLAIQLSLNILSLLSLTGLLTLFQGIEIYITILAYGAGVDYCLFLIARYKEELDQGRPPVEAVDHAVGGVGPALTASAATVICGIAMMLFAQFGKFREAGFAIPLSIFLVLCGTLTFSPAILRLAGPWAFWPQHLRKPGAEPNAPARVMGQRFWLVRPGALQHFWDEISHLLQRRPGTVWLVTAAAMAPFAVLAGLMYNHLSYDMIGDLPSDAPSLVGTQVLQQHFPAGILGQVTVVMVNEKADFRKKSSDAMVKQVTETLKRQKNDLGLADIRSLTAPLGITPAAAKALAKVHADAESERSNAIKDYTGSLGGKTARTATKFDLVLVQSPFSRWSIGDLQRIEDAMQAALPPDQRQDTAFYITGTTASIRDMAIIMAEDRTRIERLVLGAVLLILIVLLRRVVVSIYLLLSVLFSYFVTMGVAFAVFWLLDPQHFTGIDWKVAIFLFTILIAVGEDYNIFLLTRVHEEEKVHGPVGGITAALTRTGPIISSCGIIMAGTFSSLMAGSLTEMKQLGFALAFGVVLDTFVVRPILVPSFLILLASGRLPFLHKVSPPPAAPQQQSQPVASGSR